MKAIRLMADYQCHTLWNMAPGEYGDIDPSSLPITDELKRKLDSWAQRFDETLDMDDPASSGFPSVEAAEEFKQEGFRLAEQLRRELGPEYDITVRV